jgi:RNA polymerase-interacting CarD/CdnL/TRCF family regulator
MLAAMTELLERVIAQLKTLPADEQDAIAARLLAEMEDEQRWKDQFEATTDDQWDRIAEMVRKEIAVGDITPLAEVFPSQPEL